DRIEVEHRLGRGEAELFEPATLASSSLGPVVFQVFAQYVETWRNAEVDHHHVRCSGQTILYFYGGGSEVAFGQASTIVGHVDGQRFAGWLCGPGNEILTGDLIGQTPFAFEVYRHPIGSGEVDGLQDELMEEVVVFRGKHEPFRRLAVE